ncbi:hypothetical protein D9M69_651780 [compost metagenome]
MRHDLPGRLATGHAVEIGPQPGGRMEAAAGVQVVGEGPVVRARDVPRARVQRFALSGVAAGASGIDHQELRLLQVGLDVGRVHHVHQGLAALEARGCAVDHVGHQHTTPGLPGWQTAVKHPDISVTEPAQQPPQACCVGAA